MKQFLNILSDHICIADSNNEIIFINDSMYRYLGYEVCIDEDKNLREIIQIENQGEQVYINARTKSGSIRTGQATFAEEERKKNENYIKVTWDETYNIVNRECLFETFLDNMTEGVCIKDEQGTYVFVNNVYCKRLGYTKDEVIGKNDSDFWDQVYCERFKSDDEYVIKTGDRCVVEERVEMDKANKYFETTKFLIGDIQNDTQYIGIVMKNITISKELLVHQQETSEQLNYIQNMIYDETMVNPTGESLEQLKTLMKHYFKTPYITAWVYDEIDSSIGVYFRCGEKCEHDMNRFDIKSTRETFKLWVEEYANQILKIDDINIDPMSRKYLKSLEMEYIIFYRMMYKGKLIGVLTVAYKDKPKETILRNYLVNMMCVQLGLMVNNRILQEKVYKELNERHGMEKKLKALLEISADLIIQVDGKGRCVKVNAECMEKLGWSEDELLGIYVMDLVYPEDFEITTQVLLQCRKKDQIRYPLHITNRWQCKDGTYKWLRWNIKYIKEHDLFLTTAKDINYEKQLEVREQMTQKIIQLEQVRSEFFANLSHEFKTPLTIIMSAVKLLEQSDEKRPVGVNEEIGYSKYLGMIKQNSYRLLRLINNLIDVTKIDAGYLDLKLLNYNIVSLVEDIVLSVVDYAKDKEINIIFDTDTEEEIIVCDLDMIERIILNLLSNAIKYVDKLGEIQVNITTEESMMLIQVKDNGIGIPKEKIGVIFERFIQVEDVLNRKCEGSGIGLSLVKSLVELHQGTIEVESEEGIGSIFSIRLPKRKCREQRYSEKQMIVDAEIRLEKCYIEFSDIYN